MRGSRYLIAVTEQPRVRRAVDATRVVVFLLVFVWAWRRYVLVGDIDAAMAGLTDWIPGWLSGTLSAVYAFVALYVVGVLVAVLLQGRQRWDAVRDMLLAAVMTFLIVSVLARAVGGEWPRYIPELGRADPIPQFPILRAAVVAAMLRAIEPHLTRPMRRFGWGVISLSALAGVGVGLGLLSSAVGAIALGFAAAASVLLLFGSPKGYPDLSSIAAALGDLGVGVVDLTLADDQSWGVRRLIGYSERYGIVEVKAYGRDATDSNVAARVWRYVWYRDMAPNLSLTRMQSVEHEALVTMMAAKVSDSIPEVLAAGLGSDEMAILAVARVGTRMTDLNGDDITDETLIAVWMTVADLHRARISHGALTTSTVSITESGHQIGDFGSGSLGASEAVKALDVVELLFSLSQLVGVERAVESALEGLGTEELSAALPYVQPPGVQSRSRRQVDKPKALIDRIRENISQLTGVEEEEPVRLRRVTPRSLLMAGLSVFALYFLLTQLSDIDFVAVWDVVQDAAWVGMVAAFIVAQTVYLPQATAMLAAVGHPIPLRPSVILQSAIMFISLAVPSSAGRIGMTATFLRKYGVSFTASLVQGSIDTISGLIVEFLILVLAFLFGDLSLGFTSGDPEWLPLLLIVAVVAIAVVALVRRVERLRNWVMPIVSEAWGALGGVVKDPRRTLVLVASNFGSRFVLAISMWLILQSMGVSLNIFSVLAATVLTGLLGGVIPVPGGIGVSEAVLTASLVIFGVDEVTAFAAAVVYRIATFYIPSGAGWFSMRWLERNGYV